MNILLGIGGGIAAYKTPHLVRLLVQDGHSVRVCLSPNADKFVAPLSLQAVSGHPVYQHQFPPIAKDGMEHISLARWADCICIAPATASLIAQLACGMANDLLTTLALAHTGTKLLAPAMNQAMLANSLTQENLHKLQTHGWHILPTDNGEQACGESGDGRMLQPEQLLTQMTMHLPQAAASWHAWWKNKHLLITAGPTFEAIDPVRFIGNRSSGKMGYAIARTAAQLGARVTLISGPTNLSAPLGATITRVTNAAQMLDAAMKAQDWDVCIGAAAIADYTPSTQHQHKLHKKGQTLQLTLTKTSDVIASLAAQRKSPQLVIGFCAETCATEELLVRANNKRISKQLDLIVANQVGEDVVFDQDTASLWLVNGTDHTQLAEAPKHIQALHILEAITTLPGTKATS